MSDYIEREAVLDIILINYAISANDCCRILCDAMFKMVKEVPAADVRPVVRCGNCSIHDKCSTEDVFKFAGLSEDNRFCAAGRTKNGTMDAETRRLKRGLSLNELSYPYDLPNREG